ncbi:hypothetical protein PORY_000662 [Pneumocystis oryctolagi]|uniref:Uncharacterized protein n=1 Tax=Pneumocystis oryctolagi TaxID=42067 RepID=A0ACB7CF89_9ASCO|nr:hypothetical protein PORY_000662 [Pneumocystis oryctolagi]
MVTEKKEVAVLFEKRIFFQEKKRVKKTKKQMNNPSHKTFRKKIKLAKAYRQNRPVPQWIRLRTNNTIR